MNHPGLWTEVEIDGNECFFSSSKIWRFGPDDVPGFHVACRAVFEYLRCVIELEAIGGPLWTETQRTQYNNVARERLLMLASFALRFRETELFESCSSAVGAEDGVMAVAKCIQWCEDQVNRESHSGDSKDSTDSPNAPSSMAFLAYRLHVLTGAKQSETAKLLSSEFGKSVSQGQVSRWVKQAREWIAAGNVFPEIPSLSGKLQIVDPAILEMGERADGRTKRQRQAFEDD